MSASLNWRATHKNVCSDDYGDSACDSSLLNLLQAIASAHMPLV